ncbi:MAG: DUF1232 domain-containing protein [Desulfobacteraceae bacterium]|nr:MAG: DUF1232 domain-containing protein [Desulfobacteraceae bacterium]
MSLFFKIVMSILGVAYFISPLDLIPDFLIPYLGYLDDLGILGFIAYVIKYGKLPPFFPQKAKDVFDAFLHFYSGMDHGHGAGRGRRTDAKPKNGFDSAKGRQTRKDNREEKRKFNQSGTRQTYGDNPGNKTREKAASPYQILGIKENAPLSDVQAAYKNAIKKYHPDKVSHLGEEFQALAKQKFIEIQNAYEKITGDR